MTYATASAVADQGTSFLVAAAVIVVSLMLLLMLARWAARLVRRVRR